MQFEPISIADRRGRTLVTVMCGHCGLLSHADIPSDEQLTDYYREQYRAEYHGEYMPAPHRVVREWKRGADLAKLLVPHLKPRDRIFEIGCGMGCTIKQLELAGFDASGVEPGDGFRRFATQHLRARVERGVLADLHRPAHYDAVLLVHVLEHLPSPTAALSQIRALLGAGGRVYVEVPDAGAPHAHPDRMFHFAHIYNFTASTLEMLARKCGFQVLHRFSLPADRNLRVWLERREDTNWQVDAECPADTRRVLREYSDWRYYVRGAYLWDRARTILSHAQDRLASRIRVRRIERRCQADQVGVPSTRRCCSRSSAIM
jgi:SAM-dependent methyltransferase